MSRILKNNDIINILYGATLLGAGGGGSLQDGLKCMHDAEKRREIAVEMISQEEMEDGYYVGVVAAVGSPVALKQHPFRDEGLYVYETLKHAAAFEGKNMKYVMSGETGGFNMFTPMLVAMEKGLQVVDADGCGRAVPGLDVTLFTCHGVFSSPLALATCKGDTAVAYLNDPLDFRMVESIARNFCQCYSSGDTQNYPIAAFGTWLASKDDVKTKLANGMLSFCETVGKKIMEAKAISGNPAEMISSVLPCRELCQGTITKKSLEVRDGWDWGYNELTLDDGSKFTVAFKNENIVAKDADGNVLITAPDQICIIDLDTYTPLSNSDTQEGQHVQVMAMPVHENWWTTPLGVEVWRPYYECVGYHGDPIRF